MGMLIRLCHIYNFLLLMPILYNFHILLATFYMIYWTNLLIQCPVLVPVCCIFFVLQKIHIKQIPNTIKIYRELFRKYVIFGTWNQRNRGPTAPKIHQGAPQGPGVRWWVVPTRDSVCGDSNSQKSHIFQNNSP